MVARLRACGRRLQTVVEPARPSSCELTSASTGRVGVQPWIPAIPPRLAAARATFDVARSVVGTCSCTSPTLFRDFEVFAQAAVRDPTIATDSRPNERRQCPVDSLIQCETCELIPWSSLRPAGGAEHRVVEELEQVGVVRLVPRRRIRQIFRSSAARTCLRRYASAQCYHAATARLCEDLGSHGERGDPADVADLQPMLVWASPSSTGPGRAVHPEGRPRRRIRGVGRSRPARAVKRAITWSTEDRRSLTASPGGARIDVIARSAAHSNQRRGLSSIHVRSTDRFRALAACSSRRDRTNDVIGSPDLVRQPHHRIRSHAVEKARVRGSPRSSTALADGTKRALEWTVSESNWCQRSSTTLLRDDDAALANVDAAPQAHGTPADRRAETSWAGGGP
jgi:hypothetical protein